MNRYQWVVSTRGADGHVSKHLAGGFEEDKDEAIARVDEQADRLRRQNRTDWIAAVFDTTKPVLSYNPPMIGWEYVYFRDGQDGRLV
jgi:hypothetical protein